MTSTTLRAVLLLATLLLGACVSLPAPHDRQISPEVSGTVRDSITGQPLTGATVRLTLGPADAANHIAAQMISRTDGDGRFHVVLTERAGWYSLFLGPAEGLCAATVSVAHEAYEPVSFEVKQFRGGAADGMCSGYRVNHDASLKPKQANSASVAQ